MAASPSAAVKAPERIIPSSPSMIVRAIGPRAPRRRQRGAASTSRAWLLPPATWEDRPGCNERDAAAESGVVDALRQQRPVAALREERHVEQHQGHRRDRGEAAPALPDHAGRDAEGERDRGDGQMPGIVAERYDRERDAHANQRAEGTLQY